MEVTLRPLCCAFESHPLRGKYETCLSTWHCMHLCFDKVLFYAVYGRTSSENTLNGSMYSGSTVKLVADGGGTLPSSSTSTQDPQFTKNGRWTEQQGRDVHHFRCIINSVHILIKMGSSWVRILVEDVQQKKINFYFTWTSWYFSSLVN